MKQILLSQTLLFLYLEEFVDWLTEGDVKFAIIGTINAITYKEIFPLLKSNSLWLGAGFKNAVGFFKSPHNFEETETRKNKHDGLFRVPGVAWFSNIQHGKRYEPLSLMTKANNERFNKKVANNPHSYRKYDNYDAIEVPSISAIPSDYKGIMGVPITFLDKFCPEQFEILGTQRWAKSQELLDAYTGKCNPPEKDQKATIDGKEIYTRLMIRHKNPEILPRKHILSKKKTLPANIIQVGFSVCTVQKFPMLALCVH